MDWLAEIGANDKPKAANNDTCTSAQQLSALLWGQNGPQSSELYRLVRALAARRTTFSLRAAIFYPRDDSCANSTCVLTGSVLHRVLDTQHPDSPPVTVSVSLTALNRGLRNLVDTHRTQQKARSTKLKNRYMTSVAVPRPAYLACSRR